MSDDEKEIIEQLKQLEEELKPLKKYRLSQYADVEWNMGNIEDTSTFYCLNILKLRERIENLEQVQDQHEAALKEVESVLKEFFEKHDYKYYAKKLGGDKE